jgi:hypothetical protein
LDAGQTLTCHFGQLLLIFRQNFARLKVSGNWALPKGLAKTWWNGKCLDLRKWLIKFRNTPPTPPKGIFCHKILLFFLLWGRGIWWKKKRSYFGSILFDVYLDYLKCEKEVRIMVKDMEVLWI